MPANEFPRTEVGGVRLSRLVAGSNWWLGFSHQTKPRNEWVTGQQSSRSIADILDVFLRAGVNAVMSPLHPLMKDAITEAEQRVGAKLFWICTPGFDLTPDGPDWSSAAKVFDEAAAQGATFCWPHTSTTDRLYDGLARTVRFMDRACAMIRQRNMIPGLSTHLLEVVTAADRTDLDVASYTVIYNPAGFLMPIEIDWTQKVIRSAKKPVTTIKPMAAGRLMPYVGLPFAWATLRPCDLVTVGTITPDEARELIEISLACLEGRAPDRQLQTTRSKRTLE